MWVRLGGEHLNLSAIWEAKMGKSQSEASSGQKCKTVPEK
jgi:hypothetical protein